MEMAKVLRLDSLRVRPWNGPGKKIGSYVHLMKFHSVIMKMSRMIITQAILIVELLRSLRQAV